MIKQAFGVFVSIGLLGILVACTEEPESTVSPDRPTSVEPRDQVLAVFNEYGEALRTGNGARWFDTQFPEVRNDDFAQQLIERGLPPRPDLELRAEDVVVQMEEAAVFGKWVTSEGIEELAIGFVLEDGAWKINKQLSANSPIHRPAFLPPPPGRFTAAGSPWAQVPECNLQALTQEGVGENWSAKFILDDSFLYLRLTSNQAIPPEGEVLDGPSTSLSDLGVPFIPGLQIASANTAEDTSNTNPRIVVGAVVSSTGFGSDSVRSLDYSVALQDMGGIIFGTHATNDDGFIVIEEHEIDVRIPLVSLGPKSDDAITLAVGNSTPRVSCAVAVFE